MEPNLLVLKSSSVERYFAKKICNIDIPWDGSNLGRIDTFANEVPSVGNHKIFYCTRGFFFMLEEYSAEAHYIEMLKSVFGINRRPHHICFYKDKPWFMFYCEPDYERELIITRVNPEHLSDSFRVIGVFHWILGVKGKFWVHDDGNQVTVFSKGPYDVNFAKHDISKIDMCRYIPDIACKRRMEHFFNTDMINIELGEVLDEHYRNWHLRIMDRISTL